MKGSLLYTDRLILKALMPDDIHELFKTKNKQEIIDFWGTDEKGYLLYRDMHENGMETNRISLFNFLIIDKVSNLPIGECGFHTWNKMHRWAELFYLLRNDKDKQRGIMTEAVKEILKSIKYYLFFLTIILLEFSIMEIIFSKVHAVRIIGRKNYIIAVEMFNDPVFL